jgi:hypothetical protein
MSTFKAVLLKGNNHLKEDGTSNIKIRVPLITTFFRFHFA